MENKPIHTQLERMLIDKARRKAFLAVIRGLLLAGKSIILILILLAALAIEWKLGYQVFDFLMAPESENGVAIWGVFLLSLTPAIMVATFHAKAKNDPDGPLATTVRLISSALLPVYAIGMGGVLAATLWYSGANTLFGGEGDLAGQIAAMLGEAAEAAPDGWLKSFLEDHAFQALAAAFIIGAGGLSICVLYLCHVLLEAIEAQCPALMDAVEAARKLRIAMRMEKLSRRYRLLTREQTRLDDMLATAERESAEIIEMELGRALLEPQVWQRTEEFETGNGGPRIARVVKDRPGCDINQKAMAKVIAEIKGFDVETILTILRNQLHGDRT